MFDFCPSFCVTWLWSWHGLSVAKSRSSVPYAANFWIRIQHISTHQLTKCLETWKYMLKVSGNNGGHVIVVCCCSLAVAMLLLYYSFAIIGMELFSHCQLKNCCKFVVLLHFLISCLLCLYHLTALAKASCFLAVAFVRSSGQILLPWCVRNGSSSLDGTYRE